MLEFFFGPLAVAAIGGWVVAVFRYPRETDRTLKVVGACVVLAFFGYCLFAVGYSDGYREGAGIDAAAEYFSEFRWQSNFTLAMASLFGAMVLVYGPYFVRTLVLGWDYPREKTVDRQAEKKDSTE